MLTDSLSADLQRILNLTNVSVYLRPEWSSASADYRTKIRRFIYEQIESAEGILDTSIVPVLSKGSLSISHDKSLGGFVHTLDDCRLGFDLEMNERLNEKNVRRFASSEEFAAAPSAGALWTAKEAAYKVLPLEIQPTVIGEIELTNWAALEENWVTCQIGQVQKREMQNYMGAVYLGEKQSFAFFKAPLKRMNG